jgi:hypothetical protein
VIEEIVKKVYHCTCDHADCRHVWDAWEIPKRCAKCKRHTWNRPDRRHESLANTAEHNWIRLKQCTVCHGTEWIKDAQGKSVCAHCAADITSTREKKKTPAKIRK